jgi:hypothetical protein
LTAINGVEIEKTDGSLILDENKKEIVTIISEKDNLNEQNGKFYKNFQYSYFLLTQKLKT